jgi:hypothetical protein
MSLCICMCILPIVARQRRGTHFPAATNTCNNRRIIGRVVFCAVRVVSKESPWVCISPYPTATKNCWRRFLYGPCRVKGKPVGLYIPRQRRIVGGVFCTVRVVSKESTRLILARTYYFKTPLRWDNCSSEHRCYGPIAPQWRSVLPRRDVLSGGFVVLLNPLYRMFK